MVMHAVWTHAVVARCKSLTSLQDSGVTFIRAPTDCCQLSSLYLTLHTTLAESKNVQMN